MASSARNSTAFTVILFWLTTDPFGDLQDHWAKDDVEVLASRHLVHGITVDEFKPEEKLSRGQLAKLLVGMLAADPAREIRMAAPVTPSFADVPADAWYYKSVETAARLGLVKGYDGLFRPDDYVTREEMAVMLLRALGLEAQAETAADRPPTYVDDSDIAAWARGFVYLARETGLMGGMPGRMFAPTESATRAQAATVVLRAMDRFGLVLVR